MNKWNHGTLKCHDKLCCDCEPNLVTFRHHLLFRHHISSEHTHTFPQPPALNVQTFQIILLFIPPSISLSWCSVVDVKLTPLGGTRLWHHTCQQPEVSLGKIVVYEAQDSQSFLQKSQQSCSLLLQWEKKGNGISKCCEQDSNWYRHSSCTNRYATALAQQLTDFNQYQCYIMQKSDKDHTTNNRLLFCTYTSSYLQLHPETQTSELPGMLQAFVSVGFSIHEWSCCPVSGCSEETLRWLKSTHTLVLKQHLPWQSLL